MAGLQTGAAERDGLTTTRAPFIEQAQDEGRLYIHQPYELYSEANHDAWRRLFARMEDRWHSYANPRFLQGIDNLCLDPERVPRAGGRQPISQPAHRLQGQAGERLRSLLPLLRLPAEPRVPHHDHDPRRHDARLPPRAGHLPRHRRPRADAHRPRLRRHPGALRRLRPHRGRDRRRASRTSRSRSAASPASSRRWRGSSGSPSSSG